MTTINETLGERVARIRNAKQWTQEELAKKAGVAQSTVGGIENNSRAKIPGSLIDIAHALGEDAYYVRYGIRRLIAGDKAIDEVVNLMLSTNDTGKAIILDKARDISKEYAKEKIRQTRSSST